VRPGKTLERVQEAIAARSRGESVLWVHPEGSPPPDWALEALLAVGVQIQSVSPHHEVEPPERASPIVILEEPTP
jgi:hypothetical protein